MRYHFQFHTATTTATKWSRIICGVLLYTLHGLTLRSDRDLTISISSISCYTSSVHPWQGKNGGRAHFVFLATGFLCVWFGTSRRIVINTDKTLSFAHAHTHTPNKRKTGWNVDVSFVVLQKQKKQPHLICLYPNKYVDEIRRKEKWAVKENFFESLNQRIAGIFALNGTTAAQHIDIQILKIVITYWFLWLSLAKSRSECH